MNNGERNNWREYYQNSERNYIINNIINDDREDNIFYFNIEDREKIKYVAETGTEKGGVDHEEWK